MTDLCELEAALHDIRRSNEILELLVESVSKDVQSLIRVANLPKGVVADEYLLEFEVYRQRDHVEAAERHLAKLQSSPQPIRQPRLFYRNMTAADFIDGTEIMLGGKAHSISPSLLGPDWWDAKQDGQLCASYPAKHLMKHAWVQGAKRH